MKTLLPLLLALLSLSLPLKNALASDARPPTAVFVDEDFSPIRAAWQPVTGTWTGANGTYGSSAAGAADISVITSYREVSSGDPPNDELLSPEFFVRALMRNPGTTDAHLVGLVYGYQDSQNYNEVVVSALGTVQIRTVINGAVVNSSPTVHQPVPRSTWFALEVRRKDGVTTAKVNGVAIAPFSQTEFTTGKIGLVTHGTLGRFDRVFLGVPFGSQDFLETFHQAPFVTFTPQSGQWSVVNGTYRSSVQPTSLTLAPVDTGPGQTFNFTFRARMLNPSSGAANLIGIVFNHHISEYTELVFSPTGVARLNRFENGALHTVATATVGTQPNKAFEVSLENGPNDFTVLVDGVRLFANVDIFDVNPSQFPDGQVGLITHASAGRFDNVEFSNSIFRPCSLTFDTPDPSLPFVIESGTWDMTGGTLNSTAVGRADVVPLRRFQCSGDVVSDEGVNHTRETNFIYRARLFNRYGAPGNLVGLVYNYQDAANYYEVVFSSTGIMQMNRIVEDIRTTVRTATHNIPQKTWFGVQVFRQGVRTTVKLGGVPIVENQLQGELLGGSVGVITRWSKGSFDNVSLIPLVLRPASEL